MVMPVAMAALKQKSHGLPHFDYPDLGNTVIPLIMQLALWDANVNTKSINWSQKSCYTSFWSSLPMECSGAIVNAISITWCHHQVMWMLAPKVLHDQKIHVAPDFDCLYLRVVHLVTLQHYVMLMLVLHDLNTSTNGLIWPERSCCTCFGHLVLRNAMVSLMMLSTSWDADASAR